MEDHGLLKTTRLKPRINRSYTIITKPMGQANAFCAAD